MAVLALSQDLADMRERYVHFILYEMGLMGCVDWVVWSWPTASLARQSLVTTSDAQVLWPS